VRWKEWTPAVGALLGALSVMSLATIGSNDDAGSNPTSKVTIHGGRRDDLPQRGRRLRRRLRNGEAEPDGVALGFDP
jgi:hypothetical protein